MCKISPNLKLCTCAVEDASSLKDYWVLQRPYERDFHILGTTVMPFTLDFEDEKHNLEILLKSLNSGDCFDVVLDVRDKDILDIHFDCQGNEIVYAFVFEKGKWEVGEYDPFGNGNELDSGELRVEVGGLKSEV